MRAGLALIGAGTLLAAVVAWLTLSMRSDPLPSLYPMPAFDLVSEQGEPFASSELWGEVVVANFIFTNCPTVCPMLTAEMAKLQGRLAAQPGIHLLSFSVDPKNDTPEVLAAYGEKFGQDPGRWTFLTGELAAINEAVEKGFKIGMQGADDPEATAFDIVHGEHFVLVDANGVIRGYYRPEPEAFDRLVEDATRLAKEVARR